MAEQRETANVTEMAAAWIARLDSGQLSAEQLIELFGLEPFLNKRLLKGQLHKRPAAGRY